MRLSCISEAPEFTLEAWNKYLAAAAAKPPARHDDEDEAERMREWDRSKKVYSSLKKAIKFHTANFNGRRWPDLENVLLTDWGENSLMLDYLNNISEEWPEGRSALLQSMSPMYGANEKTIQYLLNKNIEAPNLKSYYHMKISPKAIRRDLNQRIQRFEMDLQKELSRPPEPEAKPAVNPTGLDDADEFTNRSAWALTVKQIQNRIKIIQQTLQLSDDQLLELVLDKRPKTASSREALGLAWAPSNMRAYYNKYPPVSK